jgi:hypothetical protein
MTFINPDPGQPAPYEGAEENAPWDSYIEPGCVPIAGAQTPDVLWLLADYDPMFYVGLMAANGITNNAVMADTAPPPIKPFIPPRPIRGYIVGRHTDAGDFVGKSSPGFVASPSWNQ